MEKIQFITHATENYNYYQSAEIALKGGIRWMQFRMKNIDESVLEKEALKIKTLCESYGADFLINDYPQLALKINASGVHLGKTDMHPKEARKLLGSEKIVGGTANTFEDIRILYDSGVDYIGLGPFRFTQTKQNLSPVLGLEGYRNIVENCEKYNIKIPILAIGGIIKSDIQNILQTGIYGIALSSTIINATNPIEEAKEIRELFYTF